MSQPPKIATRFLRWFCRADCLEEVEGDLTEIFSKEAARSSRNAKWNFAFGVIRHFRPPFMNIDIQHTTAMKSLFNVKESPYGLLLFVTLALLLALAFRPFANLDMSEITLLSYPLSSMVWAIPFLLLFMWMLYLLTVKFLYSRMIMWIHVLVTVVTTLLIVGVLMVGINPSHEASEKHELIGRTMQIHFMLFVLGQFAYVMNVLAGVLAGGRRNA